MNNLKLKFKGDYGTGVTNGRIYEVVNIQIYDEYIYLFIIDDFNELSYTPYSNMSALNRNWEVVNENTII